MTDTAGHRADPGLQPERTALAWVRTAATTAAVALLCLRVAPGPAAPTVPAAACALAVSAAILVRAARRHHRVQHAFAAERAVPAFTRCATLGALVVAMAVTAVVAAAT